MQIMTAKITTLRTLYAHVVSNSVMFSEILYDIVLYAQHFLPVKFFSEYYFYKLFRATEKCNVDRWITRVISTSTGTNEVKIGPSHLLNENGDQSFLLHFSNQCLVENIQRKGFKKIASVTFISEESP